MCTGCDDSYLCSLDDPPAGHRSEGVPVRKRGLETWTPRTNSLRNKGVTEIVEIEGPGQSLTIDNGLREVCDKALEFVKRFV